MTSGPTLLPLPGRVESSRAQHLRVLVAVCMPLLFAILIAGCGDNSSVAPAAAPTAAARVHVTATVGAGQRVPDPPDGAESTAYAPGVVPQFLASIKDNTKDKVTARYQFAVAHRDALAQIPCFCGCALYEHAHTSLESCYIRQVDANGKVVYTDHSTTCDICSGEVDMMMGQIDTTPLGALRAQIEKKYGYTHVWTDTPPIQ